MQQDGCMQLLYILVKTAFVHNGEDSYSTNTAAAMQLGQLPAAGSTAVMTRHDAAHVKVTVTLHSCDTQTLHCIVLH